MERICKHCSMDISIRNPSGYCDHLYYPENCEVCRGPKMTQISETELSRLRQVEEVARELLKLATSSLYNGYYENEDGKEYKKADEARDIIARAEKVLGER